MELVLTLLAVDLLVVLPIAFFLLASGGLFYVIGRAIRAEKEKEKPATLVVTPEPARDTDVLAVKVVSASGNIRHSAEAHP
jgi:hypothetical protein